MHLDALYVQVLPRLSHTGSSEHLNGVFNLPSIEVGTRHFDVPEGISYEIDLTNTSEAILLSGTATACLATRCDKCLEPATLALTGEVQGYFLFDASSADDGESLEVYEEVDRDGRIDIAAPLLAAIVVELPTVALCKPQCEGIEGIELESIEATGLVEEADLSSQEDTPKESPFAALKDFKFEDSAQ